jgi:hypothetical protein
MSNQTIPDCKGLLGKILGHKFKPYYDTDTEKRSAEELATILHNVHEHNKWAYIKDTVKPNIEEPKRVTKILKGVYCSRCGTRIEDDLRF